MNSRFELTPSGSQPGGFADGEWSREVRVPRYEQRLRVAGSKNDFAGYGVGAVPAGQQGRQVTQGPLVPGPWAYTYGRSTCLANDPRMGTAADIERDRASGMLVEAKPGDILALDGVDFLLVLDGRGYPNLVLVTPELDLEAEVARVRGMRSLFRTYHGAW